jgi:hypothetical protein
MFTAAWVVLTLLSAVLYVVLVYLVSIGSRVERMRDPATAPVWRLLLAGVVEEAARAETAEEIKPDDHHRTAA